jgi:hypothetical protein
MSDELSQTLFNGFSVKIQTDTAKLNAMRCFYMDQTRPAFPELYNSGEDPQIRLNVKVALCLVMSEPSPGTEQRYYLTGAVDDLWRKACQVLETSAQPGKDVKSVLRPLRVQLDDIALLPDLQKLNSEELYQLFKGVFIPNNVQCPSTREEAKEYLVQSYSSHYVDYRETQNVAECLTRFLELPYDELRV